MASDNTLFKPKAYPIRQPTEVKQKHGSMVNPPRLNQIGGMDKLHEKYGVKKNSMTLKKPGGTK